MPIPHHGTAVSRAAHNTALDTERKVSERIEAKRKEVAGLEAARDELALEVILDTEGAKEKYDALQAKVDRAEGELKLLETAGQEAQRRAERAAFERRKAEKVELRRNQTKLRMKQIAAAKEVEAALETVLKGMHRLQELGSRIAATLPDVPVTGYLVTPGELHEAIGIQAWKISVQPTGPDLGDQFKNLPGTADFYPGHLLSGQPGQAGVGVNEMVPSLVERIKEAADFADRVFMEQRNLAGHVGPNTDYEPLDFDHPEKV
jgi:hypothetical protein